MSDQQHKRLTLEFNPGCMLFGMVFGLILWLVLHPGNYPPKRCSVCHAPIDRSCTNVTIRTRTGMQAAICAKCLETLKKTVDNIEFMDDNKKADNDNNE